MRAVSMLVLGVALWVSPIAHAQDAEADAPDAPSGPLDLDLAGDAPRASGTYVSPGAIVGFVATGVGLLTFAIAGGLAIAEDLRLQDACASLCLRGAANDLRTFALISDLGLGLAFASATLGLVFLFAGRGPDGAVVVAVAPVLDADGGGLLVAGRL